MSTRSYRAVYLLTGLLLAPLATAKSPVWKVSSGEDILYLGGTIHVLSPSDYPLPKEFEQAYVLAATVVFETDMQKLQQPSFQREMLQYLMYQKGKTLDQVLDKDTYALLDQYMQNRGVTLDQLKRFKPGMLASTITMLELQRLSLAGTGVDQFFSSRAIADSKPQGKLETAISQIQKNAAMGEGQENDFIRHTLQELETLPDLIQSIKQAWREGDSQQLYTVALQPLATDFPGIYQSLMVDRNIAWLPSFIDMLNSEEVELVLVGAAHLIGEHGLLKQLEELGYVVEQM